MAFPLCMFPLAELRISTALTGMLNRATAIFTRGRGSHVRRLPSRNIAFGLAAARRSGMMGVAGARGATGDWRGVVMILAALASYGVAFNLAAPLQQRNGALPVLWRALFIGMLLTAPLGLRDAANAQWKLTSILALLALGALGTGVSFIVFATAAGRMGATRASATTFITPVVALLLGVVFRNETVTSLAILGAAICLAGAWLIRKV
jgi:drug/metabolite transporter (DMT)-like permease